MNNRRIAITIISVIVISALILVLWSLFFRSKSQGDITPEQGQVVDEQQEVLVQEESLPAPSPERQEEEKNYPLGVRQLAFSFAERYGSYSNQAPGEHINDLLPLMSRRMKGEIERNYRQGNLNIEVYDAYESRALSGKLEDFSDSKAKVLVSAQRTHHREGLVQSDVFYQDVMVELIKIGDEWKVDRINWYPRR